MSLSASTSFASIPSSDVFTLIVVKDASEKVTSHPKPDLLPNPRRVKVNRRSPLGRFPPITPASLLEAAQKASELVDTGVSSPVAPRSRVNLGLGHPSNSARRVNPSTMTSTITPPPLRNTASLLLLSRTRIISSIAMSRTVRSAECELNLSVIPATQQQSADRPTRPVPGPRKRSYAAAAATSTTTPINGTNEIPPLARRITPTSSSPRCAQQTPGGALATMQGTAPATTPGAALPPRHTSLGFPLAGPTQVQSPRVLVAPYRGNPLFQPLDGAAQSIMVGAQKVGKTTSVDEEAKGKAMPAEGAGEVTYVLREDAWLKLKYIASLKTRLAARRLRTCFGF